MTQIQCRRAPPAIPEHPTAASALAGAARGMLLVVLALILSPAQAGVYKWVDENGKVHYSDKPPAPSAEQMEIDVQQPSTSAPAVSDAERRDKLNRLLDAFAKERADKQELAAKEKEEKQKRKAECANMRNELKELEEAAYLYDYDEGGEKVYYSEEEHARALAEYEAAYAKYC